MGDAEGGGRPPLRKLYGRRKGKALRPAQVKLLGELLPHLRIPGVTPPGDPDRSPIDPLRLFGRPGPVWLEIGSGGGEHAVHAAASNPEVGVIACEPFVNGVAMLLGRIEAQRIGNIRIHPGDARDLIELLPEASLARVFLLYPDPWPKTRHRGRRFVSAGNLELLRRAMAPGAELRLATDMPAYVSHALEAVAAAPGFALAEGCGPDWGTPWPGWPGTRYEAKALRQGRRAHYLTFVRE